MNTSGRTSRSTRNTRRQRRDSEDIEKTGSGTNPVVYVARASHASYFRPVETLIERADGGRHAPPLILEVITDDEPSWCGWEGGWGDTQPPEGPVRIGESSPGGPCKHEQWADPGSLIETVRATFDLSEFEVPPPAPQFVVGRAGPTATPGSGTSSPAGSAGSATQLLVTVTSLDDKVPPYTFTRPLDGARGSIDTGVEIDPSIALRDRRQRDERDRQRQRCPHPRPAPPIPMAKRPAVLLHGYSGSAHSMRPWHDALVELGYPATTLRLGQYYSLTNEITIKDLAEAFDRALRNEADLAPDKPFDAIVHSTGWALSSASGCRRTRSGSNGSSA